MKMRRLLIVLLTFFVCAFGLSGPVLAADSNMQTVVEGLNSTWNKAFNKGDASAVAALYHEKATLSPGHGKTLVGRAEIEKLFKSLIYDGVQNHNINIVLVHGNGVFVY